MSWDEVSGSVCPVGRSLALVGDRWTLLILRELGMGTHRFDELQAQTGMSSHLLTTRLKRLERDGIVERRQYSARPLRYEYHATAKGKELDPVLMMLRSWGRKWQGDCPPGEPSCRLVHKKSGIELDHLWQVPPEDQPTFTFDDVEATMGEAFKAEREGRRASFQAAQAASRKRAARPDGPGPADS
jgi:DNA-binding HxlR family transcriptional regulator